MIRYEWTDETIEDGEIVDSHFEEKLADLAPLLGGMHDVGLVRDDDKDQSRLWAYVSYGKLPEYFQDAHQKDTRIKVPVKYQLELKRYVEAIDYKVTDQTAFTFNKGNRVDGKFHLRLQQIKEQYRTWLNTKEGTWIVYYGHRTVADFVTSKEGLDSTCDRESMWELTDQLLKVRHEHPAYQRTELD